VLIRTVVSLGAASYAKTTAAARLRTCPAKALCARGSMKDDGWQAHLKKRLKTCQTFFILKN